MGRIVDPEAPVPGMDEWRVRQLVAHLASAPAFYLGGPDGTTRFASDGTEMREINAVNVASLESEPIDALRARLRDGFAQLIDRATRPEAASQRWPAHGGHEITWVDALGLLLGELDVHGFDLARARGEPWVIPGGDVELIMRGLGPLMPAWVDPAAAAGHTASYEIRLRGQGVHRWQFSDGALTVEPDGPWHPDVVISGSPMPTLLVFYGRIGKYGAMLRGQVLAWGRRPWLALTIDKRLLPA
jgi:hypothetical protein